MASCSETGCQESRLLTEEGENTEQLTKLTTEALTLSDGKQQPKLLMQESPDCGTESTNTEDTECARLSSSDSVVRALEEELSSCDLAASDAALNVTFIVEVSSLDISTSPTRIQKCISNRNDSKSFVIETSRKDGISVPGGRHLVSSARPLSPVVCKQASSYVEGSLDNEAAYHGKESSDNIGVNDVEGKVTRSHRSDSAPDFGLADDELERSLNSFELDDNEDNHATSTPLSSHVVSCIKKNNFNTEQSMKPLQCASPFMERKCPKYISSACRMLQMREGNVTAQEVDVGILNESFAVSPFEKDCNDQLFKVFGSKHDQTYVVSELSSSATENVSNDHVLSVGYSDHRLSLSENLDDSSFAPHWSAREQNTDLTVDDLSLANIDVFKEDANVASFFVTEWPSAMMGDCCDQPVSSASPQRVPLTQTSHTSSPCQLRVVVKSASSVSDLFTDWSFSSIIGQAYPSFDGSTANDPDEYLQTSVSRFSDVTSLELDENSQQLHCSSE